MTDSNVPAGVIEHIDVEQIDIIDDHNPRIEFGQEKLLELGQSMEENTQLAPIIVHKNAYCRYDLVAGERRLRAAINVGQKTIEARVFEGLSKLRIIQMALAENRDRVGLNVIEEAYGYTQLMEHGIGIEQIAESEHCSADKIRKRLDLLQLDEDVQDMIVRQKNPLPIHQALVLKKLPKDEQYQVAKRAAPESGPVASEAMVREMVDDITKPKLPNSEPEPDQEQEENNIEPDKLNPDGPDKETAETQEREKHEEENKRLKKVASEVLKLKPIDVTCGIRGKMTVSEDGRVCIRKAVTTVKVGDKVETKNLPEIPLDFEADDLVAVIGMIKKNQPKPKK